MTAYLIISLSILFLLILSYLLKSKRMTFPFIYCVQAGGHYTLGTINTEHPLSIDKDLIRIIDWKNTQFNPPLRFMADPFIVEEKGTFYIFFEQFNFKLNALGADIAVLKSNDLENWEYLGIVLYEKFHLSYPYVFKWENKWYMIPESVAVKEVRLYESEDFPFKWKLKNVIIENIIADSTLIIAESVFYILGMCCTDNSLRLYYSDNLFYGWKEHPQSPIRVGECNDIRPAGRPETVNRKLVYFIQDNSLGYGTGVIAYEINKISKTEFSDRRIENNPILFRFGNGWAASGMHHLSCIKTSDSNYFCVVDGLSSYKSKEWRFSWRNLPEFMIVKYQLDRKK